jgi:hypothetical protein
MEVKSGDAVAPGSAERPETGLLVEPAGMDGERTDDSGGDPRRLF